MNNYGVVLMGDVIKIDADYYKISEGFVNFFEQTELVGSYASSLVESVVKQKKYTEAEVLALIAGDDSENL